MFLSFIMFLSFESIVLKFIFYFNESYHAYNVNYALNRKISHNC